MACRLYVVKSPLIGMPKVMMVPWVRKLHHSVVIDVEPMESNVSGRNRPSYVHLFDVIPADATSPLTLISMVKGDAVPALPRCKKVTKMAAGVTNEDLVGSVTDPGGDGSMVLAAAAAFQREYFEGPDGARMGLYHRNCIHFSKALVEHVLVQFSNGNSYE